MRKTTIKSIYHWTIMTLVMGASLMLNLIGSLPNTYGQTDVVSYKKEEFQTITNENEIRVGEDYYFDFSSAPNDNDYYLNAIVFNDTIFHYTSVQESVDYPDGIYNSIDYPNWSLVFSGDLYLGCSGYIGFEMTEFDYAEDQYYLFVLGNFGRYENVDVYAIDNPSYHVYDFTKKLLNMSINSWYNIILENTVGGYSDTYNSLEFLKAYPLYAEWVLILDLAFDCLAFLPKVIHNLVDKLEGEKE